MAPTDLHPFAFHHHVLRVELPVAALKGLGHPLHRVNDLQTAHQVHVHLAGIAHQAQHSLIFTHGQMDAQPQILEPMDELVTLVFGNALFEYNDHFFVLRFL